MLKSSDGSLNPYFSYISGQGKEAEKGEMEEREKGCEGSHPSVSSGMAAPDAPPLTGLQSKRNGLWKISKGNGSAASSSSSCIWNRLFEEGYRADVCVYTDDGKAIHAHACVLVSLNYLSRKWYCFPGSEELVEAIPKPSEVHIHPRRAPCSCQGFSSLPISMCDEKEMEEFGIHVLVLSHAFVVPWLKEECIRQLEKRLLKVENAIDIFQLAYYCDAPRLQLISHRMILNRFREVSATERWKTVQESEPLLEKELLESMVEADSAKEERLKRLEEKKIYESVWEVMEALVHICRDGCKTIGPCDQALKGEGEPCRFAACKGLENLIRHFAGCRARSAAGCCCCVQCKRMWQLLELHSRICVDRGACKVPLCRYAFRGKSASSEQERRGKMEAVGEQSDGSEEMCQSIAL
ncbi:hypothetical protein ACLOJK_003587 [Asimina triloba]